MTRVRIEHPGDQRSPDFSTCEHCGEPIGWDDYCYVHTNGWAECGTTITGGEPVGNLNQIIPGIDVPAPLGTVFRINPTIISTTTQCAEPKEWYEDVE